MPLLPTGSPLGAGAPPMGMGVPGQGSMDGGVGPLLAALGAPDPSAPAPADPAMAEEAVWGMFPGTDPNVLMQLAGNVNPDDAEALINVLGTIRGLQAEDERKLEAMHKEQLDALLAALMMPAPGAELDESQPAPAIGGETSGF